MRFSYILIALIASIAVAEKYAMVMGGADK